ncbi:MAG: FecR family protein, partial [Flavobacteriales bacterium]
KKEPRQVEVVYGEAYFDVSPSTANAGTSFKVYNKNQEIKVLGTEFNIKAYKNELNIYTTLVEGKVAITTEHKNNILSPGEQSILNINTTDIRIAQVDIKPEISWREGIFIFKKKPLKEIMTTLSRWYDMEVVFLNKDAETIQFNGSLNKNQSIEAVLNDIKNFGIINNYEIKNKTVTIK